MQILDDLFTLRLGQRGNLVVEITHAVVDIDAQLIEQGTMLFKGILVKNSDTVAEHDGVRDLHHCRLDVQREHHASLAGVFNLTLVELKQRLFAHEHAVDDFAFEQLNLRLEHQRLATLGDQLHLHIASTIQRHRLLAMVEVSAMHVRYVTARGLAPLTHAMGILAGILFDRLGRPTVGVTLAQHRVDRTSHDLAIPRLDLLLFSIARLIRVIRQVVALFLQLLDGCPKLRHGSTDIGQLDDIGFRLLGQGTQFGKVILNPLLGGQIVGELGKDSRSQGDVPGLYLDAGSIGEGVDDW